MCISSMLTNHIAKAALFIPVPWGFLCGPINCTIFLLSSPLDRRLNDVWVCACALHDALIFVTAKKSTKTQNQTCEYYYLFSRRLFVETCVFLTKNWIFFIIYSFDWICIIALYTCCCRRAHPQLSVFHISCEWYGQLSIEQTTNIHNNKI